MYREPGKPLLPDGLSAAMVLLAESLNLHPPLPHGPASAESDFAYGMRGQLSIADLVHLLHYR